MTTQNTYEQFLALIKPGMLDANGRFLGPDHDVNFQAEGMTPQEFYNYMNQQVEHQSMAGSGGTSTYTDRGPADPRWNGAAVRTKGMGAGPAFALSVLTSGLGSYFSAGNAATAAETGFSGMGTATGWNAAMDSQAANLGFGSAQAAIDAGAMAPAAGMTATAGSVGAEMAANGQVPESTFEVEGSNPPGGDPSTPTDASPSTEVNPPGGNPSTPPSGKSLLDMGKDLISKRYMDAAGNINWTNVLKDGTSAVAAVTAFQQASNGQNSGSSGGSGYTGTVPSYTALRAAVPTPTGARPGAGGLRYLTDVHYNGNGAEGAAAQQAAVSAEQATLAAQNQANVSAQQAANGGPYIPGAINTRGGTTQNTSGGAATGTTPGASTPGANTPGGGTMPSTPTTAGTGDGMWVQGKYITKAELQNAFAQGVNPVEYLQKNGVTDLGQIHNLVTQAEGIAGNAPAGDAALQKYFKQYQQYNPNGKYANDFGAWVADQQPANLNAMRAGVFTGAVTSQADWAPGGIYGPGSAYYGQAGYGSGQGPRGMGDLGGGWDAPGAATGGNGQLTPAQQKQVMDASARGQPLPTFGAQAPVSATDISAFYAAHKNDPAAIQAAMAQYHITPQQAAAATGQNASVFTPAVPPANPGAVSAADINGFYQAHKNDPAALQAAMQQYGVTADQAAAATGQSISAFSPKQVYEPQAPAQPAPSAPQAEQKGPGISNADINGFWQQHQNDPAALKAAMQQYGVTADQAAAATGQNASAFQFAGGGLAGTPMAARYLRGPTDGMADQIPARIDGQQEAALGHGEFVVPADVVSHLGNGNSDAGAEALHTMMDKIRVARTGTKRQGREIDPAQFTPGGGGLRYAMGGRVMRFDTGGVVPSGSGITGTSSNLSDWIAPYTVDMLAKGKALTDMPYQAYQGPLTAGSTDLQNQAYTAASGLSTPGVIGQAASGALQAGQTAGGTSYAPTTFTAGDFTAPGTASQFMSPYMDNVVQNQQRDAQRNADIATTYRQGEQTKAGAFGGSRAAIMDAEAARNLALQKGDIAATGLQAAFNSGQNQFNTQQQSTLANGQATEASKQFGANLGLQGINTQLNAYNTAGNLGATQANTGIANINAQLGAGGVQQGIEQAGVTADQAAFDKEQNNPFKMLTYSQGLLQGLPLSTQSYNVATNPLASAANTASGIASLWNAFTS